MNESADTLAFQYGVHQSQKSRMGLAPSCLKNNWPRPVLKTFALTFCEKRYNKKHSNPLPETVGPQGSGGGGGPQAPHLLSCESTSRNAAMHSHIWCGDSTNCLKTFEYSRYDNHNGLVIGNYVLVHSAGVVGQAGLVQEPGWLGWTRQADPQLGTGVDPIYLQQPRLWCRRPLAVRPGGQGQLHGQGWLRWGGIPPAGRHSTIERTVRLDKRHSPPQTAAAALTNAPEG